MASVAFSRNLTVNTQRLGQERRSVSPAVPARVRVEPIPRSKSAMVTSSNNFLSAVQQSYGGEARRPSPAGRTISPAAQKRQSLPGGLSPTHAMQSLTTPRMAMPPQASQPLVQRTVNTTATAAAIPRTKPFSYFSSDAKAAAAPPAAAPPDATASPAPAPAAAITVTTTGLASDTAGGAPKPKALSPKDAVARVHSQGLKFPGVTIARVQSQPGDGGLHARPLSDANRRPLETPRAGLRGSISLARDQNQAPAADSAPEVIRVERKLARPEPVQIGTEKLGYRPQSMPLHTPPNAAVVQQRFAGGQPEPADQPRAFKAATPARPQPSFGKPSNADLTQTSFGGLLIKTDGQKLCLMCRRCEHVTCTKENPGCLLDCQDVLCLNCCQQLLHMKGIACPFCRAQTPLADREMSDLVVPPGITELLEIKREDLGTSSLETLMDEAGAVCPICLDPLALPKMPFLLNCGHNLCEECLLMVQCKAKGGDLECPQCLQGTPSAAPTVNVMLMYIVAQLRTMKAKLTA